MATNIEKLEQEVLKLSSSELVSFASWFNDYQHKKWDAQIEADSLSGKLSGLRDAAMKASADGRLKKL